MSDERGDRTVPGETDRGSATSDLLRRPHLVPAHDAVSDPFRSLREAGSAVAWVARAWLRPSGSEARWEQRAGHEILNPASESEAGGEHRERPDEPGTAQESQPAQGQTRTTGTGQ